MVFEKDNHAYCLHHLVENFLQVAGKHGIRKKAENFLKVIGKRGIRKEATKQLVKEMLYRVAYAPTLGEYNDTMQVLRAYKPEPVKWVDDNEPE